jgi:hypothetical protein
MCRPISSSLGSDCIDSLNSRSVARRGWRSCLIQVLVNVQFNVVGKPLCTIAILAVRGSDFWPNLGLSQGLLNQYSARLRFPASARQPSVG